MKIVIRGGSIQKQLTDDLKDSLTTDSCTVEKITTLHIETDSGIEDVSVSVEDTYYDSNNNTWTIVYRWVGSPPYVDTYYRRLELRTNSGKIYAVYTEEFYVSSDVESLEIIWLVYIHHE